MEITFYKTFTKAYEPPCAEMTSVIVELIVKYCATNIKWFKKNGSSNPRCGRFLSESAYGL